MILVDVNKLKRNATSETVDNNLRAASACTALLHNGQISDWGFRPIGAAIGGAMEHSASEGSRPTCNTSQLSLVRSGVHPLYMCVCHCPSPQVCRWRRPQPPHIAARGGSRHDDLVAHFDHSPRRELAGYQRVPLPPPL